MYVCPSCVIPQSSRTLRLFCSVCAAPNSATAKLCFSSSRLLQLFLLPCACLKSVCLCLSLHLPSFSHLNHIFHPLVHLSLALSHSFSPTDSLILVFHPLPFPVPLFLSLTLTPSPSPLIRAICWRGRQRDLTVDRIVLYVESVVQRWSQPCAYLRASVARMLVFVCQCVQACSHV